MPADPPRSTPARPLLIAGWLAAAVVALLIGVGALRLVGESFGGTPGGVLSQQDVQRQLASATATPGATPAAPGATPATPVSPSAAGTHPGTARPSTAHPGASASPARQTFRARGGSAVAECDGSAAVLVVWWPAQGFGTHEVEPGPASEAEVDFRGPAGRSKIEVRCVAGKPVAEYDED